MRILCLHGSGASGEIMKSQIASLLTHLPSTYTYDYLDSPIPCAAAPELKAVYPGPYSCFFTHYTPSEMASAVEYVREVVDDDGPYDCVIGFSQGAAVAAAYLATLASTTPSSDHDHDRLLKLAIFVCAALVPPLLSSSVNTLVSSSPIGNFGPISTPSIHIIGRKDPCASQSLDLAKACTPTQLTAMPQQTQAQILILSDVGHEIPRDATNTRKIATEIERALMMTFVR